VIVHHLLISAAGQLFGFAPLRNAANASALANQRRFASAFLAVSFALAAVTISEVR
jgi:hypothetical protein